MKSNKLTRTLIIVDGIEVTKVDEITPFVKISDHLRDNRNNNLKKKR